MDRWKSRGGKSQRGEEQKREDQRRERVRRKKMQVREKVGKSRSTVFFQWFVAPEGRKVGSPKRRVRSHVVRWEIKNCTPLWREAHVQVKMYKHTILGPLLEVDMSKKRTPLWREARFQVKMHKAHQVRSTFRSCDVEKSAHKCTPLWCEAHFQVKMYKAHHSRTTFGSWHVEKVHAIVARSTFPSQNVKSTTCPDHFWTFRCRFAWQAQGIVHLVRNQQKREGFVELPKTMAGVGHLKRIWKDVFRVAGQETCSSEMLGGQGADFLRGVAFSRIRS